MTDTERLAEWSQDGKRFRLVGMPQEHLTGFRELNVHVLHEGRWQSHRDVFTTASDPDIDAIREQLDASNDLEYIAGLAFDGMAGGMTAQEVIEELVENLAADGVIDVDELGNGGSDE